MDRAMPPLSIQLSPDALRLFCPAKLNLALSVGAPDTNRLHPIASWMVPIAFGDTLELRRCKAQTPPKIVFADDAPRGESVDWPIERDLAVLALRAVETRIGCRLEVAIDLTKRVPTGAGLGGGSADAAAMLDGLNRLFELGLTGEDLHGLAGSIGADVDFQLASRLNACGAVVHGFGELIDPLPPSTPHPVLLVLPAFGCPTAEVYRAYDRACQTGTPRVERDRVRALAAKPIDHHAAFWNDLVDAACMVRPELRRVIDLAALAGERPHVTGSGSAVFVLPRPGSAADHERARQRLADATGCAVMSTFTAG